MSKELEKEYRNLMEENTPDLWDRIERGLETKDISAARRRRRLYRLWGSAAAACLCLAVSLSVLLRNSGNTRSGEGVSGNSAVSGNAQITAADAGSGPLIPDGEAGAGSARLADAAEMPEAENEEECGEDNLFRITGLVEEVSDAPGEAGCSIRVLSSDLSGFSEGDTVFLLRDRAEDVPLAVGETFLFSVSPVEDGEGVRYMIEAAEKEP